MTNNHLQVAAAEVRRGMEQVHKEISDLQKRLDDERRLTDQKIASLQNEIREDQAQLARSITNSGPGDQVYKQEQMRDINQRQQQIDRLRNELNQKNQQIQSDIQTRQTELDRLNSQARELENKAAAL